MSEKQISATEFKAKCLRLIDEVAANGPALVITKRGKPVAKLTRAASAQRPLAGGCADLGKIVGDIVHFDLSDRWDAMKK